MKRRRLGRHTGQAAGGDSIGADEAASLQSLARAVCDVSAVSNRRQCSGAVQQQCLPPYTVSLRRGTQAGFGFVSQAD